MRESTLIKYKLVIDAYLLNGFNGVAAYMEIYPNATYKTASKGFDNIQKNTEIAEYLKAKQEQTAESLGVQFENQINELTEIKDKAKKLKDFGPAIAAIKEQNKLLGFYEKHNGQKKPLATQIVFKIKDFEPGEINEDENE